MVKRNDEVQDMKIKEFIRKNTKATTASIKYFNEQPLNSLGQLIPTGIVTTSMVGFIVAIVKFVISGGFTNQITVLKGDFYGRISEGFTFGTVSVLTSGIVSTVISILLLAELIVLIISLVLLISLLICSTNSSLLLNLTSSLR